MKNILTKSIIGFNQNGSVLNAFSEQHNEVERSFSQPSYHSKNHVAVIADLVYEFRAASPLRGGEDGEKSFQFRYAKMKVLASHKAIVLNPF